MSLLGWWSKAARDRATWRAARIGAEQDRLFPGESAAWMEDGADRIFGQDAM
jgi:hypothetical protein